MDDSSYVYKWLPWSNPLRHRYGYHGVTPYPYIIAIYSKVLPNTTYSVLLTLIYGKLCCQKLKGHVLLAQTVLPNDVRVQRSL